MCTRTEINYSNVFYSSYKFKLNLQFMTQYNNITEQMNSLKLIVLLKPRNVYNNLITNINNSNF